MEKNVITLTWVMLLLLSGCGQYKVGDDYFSLDEALSEVKQYYRNFAPTNKYFWELQSLWEQASAPSDKEIIEKEMLAFLSELLELQSQGYFEHQVKETLRDSELLKEQATSEEIKTMIETRLSEFAQKRLDRDESEKKRQQERERKEQTRVEHLQTELKKVRDRLIQSTNGSLRDKSAQEVKKIVDEWGQQSLRWELREEDYYAPFFSPTTFYRIFGKPERQQFLSGDYLFYYHCKDGLVQIQVSGSALDRRIVIIKELSIL